jgi:hypothetical protein
MTVESIEPIVASRRPLYEGSTQFKHWRFSQEQLTQIRTSLNAAAVTAIQKALEIESVRAVLKVVSSSLTYLHEAGKFFQCTVSYTR